MSFIASLQFYVANFSIFICRSYVNSHSCSKTAISREGEGEESSSREQSGRPCQLEVGEGDKKKRKGSDARISIPVKTFGPNYAAVGQAANVEGEVKSPTKKKSRTLSRKTKKDRDVTEVDKD